ncbi:hypothetical protein KUV24_11285 [Nitratireductor sp. DP7N14-4]|nr:hypothetical protein [Nitratireductor sp. DP7N14-4]
MPERHDRIITQPKTASRTVRFKQCTSDDALFEAHRSFKGVERCWSCPDAQAWILGSSPRMTTGDGVQSISNTVAYKRQNTLVILGLDPGIHAGSSPPMITQPKTASGTVRFKQCTTDGALFEAHRAFRRLERFWSCPDARAWILGSSPRMTTGDGVQYSSNTVAYKRQNTLVILGLDPGIHARTPRPHHHPAKEGQRHGAPQTVHHRRRAV